MDIIRCTKREELLLKDLPQLKHRLFSLLCIIQRNQITVFSSRFAVAEQRKCLLKSFILGDMLNFRIGLFLLWRSCFGIQDVAWHYPRVFQQPWEVVAPDTMLMPGQKFYIVPLSTIQKLQRVSSSKDSASSSLETEKVPPSKEEEEEEEDGIVPHYWLYKHKSNLNLSPACTTSSGSEAKNENYTGRKSTARNGKKDDLFHDNCNICLLMGMKMKGSGDDLREETRTASSGTNSTTGPPETKAFSRKRTNKDITRNEMRMSSMRLSYLDYWQPNLEASLRNKSN